jgi:hypothetical protein
MPKTGATLCGLVLVAICIGLNTARYPVVWRMVASTTAPPASDPSSPATDQPAPSRDPLPSASPEPASGPAAAVKPVPDVAQGDAGTATPTPSDHEEGVTPAETKTAAPETAPANEGPAHRPTKPALVPVPAMPPAGAIAAGGDAATAVRRLPPVDPNQPRPPGLGGSGSPDGTFPIYPSTGIR